MKSLLLNDSFYEIFKERMKVDEDSVTQTYVSPLRMEALENGFSLFLKNFFNKQETSYLLIGTQEVANETKLSFAYWIPMEIINGSRPLLFTLEEFAKRFGCKIKMLETQEYFIENIKVPLVGNFESPFQILEILGSPHIPCESYCFYNEIEFVESKLIDCYYCFAIDNNKYFTWLYKIPTSVISIKSEWHDYLSEIKSILSPFGNTGLTILTTQNLKEKNDLISFTSDQTNLSKTELEIPTSYVKPFNRIVDATNNLKGKEKIMVVPKFENDKCLFCGSINVSREHIFPIWMRGYFEEKFFTNSLYTKLPNEDLLDSLQSGLSKRKESSFGYVTHKVCVECNGTWMSQLEETAKNILSLGSSTLRKKISDLDISHKNSTAIALWIITKTILLYSKSNIPIVLPNDVLSHLKEGKIIDGFLVEIAECEFYDLNYCISKGSDAIASLLKLKKMSKEEAEDLTNDFLIASIHIGHFIFRISYLDKSIPLSRESCIKATKVIYPYSYDLPYYKVEEAEALWESVDNELRLALFNIGMSLID